MVCREKKSNAFHTEVYLKTELFLHWLKRLFNWRVVHSERNILSTQTLTQCYHALFVSCGSNMKRHLAVTQSEATEESKSIEIYQIWSGSKEIQSLFVPLWMLSTFDSKNAQFNFWNMESIHPIRLISLKNLYLKKRRKIAHSYIDLIPILNLCNQTLTSIIFFSIW